MPSSSPKLTSCVVRIGEEMNWWIEETSDPQNWDTDGLAIIDPRQMAHVLELVDPLREYGFDPDLLENAFFLFRIDKTLPEGRVRLVRVRDSLLENEEALFALPDIVDDEQGPYAELLDEITRYRVKMLNDLIDFEQKLTIDELEEEIRENQAADFMEGTDTHFFNEITAILEYVPEGFELDDEDGDKDDDELGDFPEIEDSDEKIEEDETMKWDEDDDDEDEDDEDEDEDEEAGDAEVDDDGDEEEERPRRRRR